MHEFDFGDRVRHVEYGECVVLETWEDSDTGEPSWVTILSPCGATSDVPLSSLALCPHPDTVRLNSLAEKNLFVGRDTNLNAFCAYPAPPESNDVLARADTLSEAVDKAVKKKKAKKKSECEAIKEAEFQFGDRVSHSKHGECIFAVVSEVSDTGKPLLVTVFARNGKEYDVEPSSLVLQPHPDTVRLIFLAQNNLFVGKDWLDQDFCVCQTQEHDATESIAQANSIGAVIDAAMKNKGCL